MDTQLSSSSSWLSDTLSGVGFELRMSITESVASPLEKRKPSKPETSDDVSIGAVWKGSQRAEEGESVLTRW